MFIKSSNSYNLSIVLRLYHFLLLRLGLLSP